MTIALQVGWRQLAVGVAVLVGAVGLMVWWSSPARSQGVGPAAVDTFAFVARADNPVDALAASSAAGQLGAPVYLTFPDGLDEQAAEGLKATDPQVVVLAGGTVALSEAVEQQIAELLPDATIRRFAGIGRTETAKLINELTGQLGVNRPVLAGATVAGDVGIDGALTVDDVDVGAKLAALSARIDSLESDLSAANGGINALESTLAGVSRDGDTLTFSSMNVRIVNGQGATATTNGLGNLIVGYNEDHTDHALPPVIRRLPVRGGWPRRRQPHRVAQPHRRGRPHLQLLRRVRRRPEQPNLRRVRVGVRRHPQHRLRRQRVGVRRRRQLGLRRRVVDPRWLLQHREHHRCLPPQLLIGDTVFADG